MAVALPRRSVRNLTVAPRATRGDRYFGQLTYLQGWWYGAADCLGFHAVRIRMPGDVSGPSPAPREALMGMERDTVTLARQLLPHLWAEYLRARELSEAPAVRVARCGDLLHEHFRVEAMCAAPFGEERTVELAIEPRWAPGTVLGAYVEDRMLVEFRRQMRPWRTP
jgi:hypothetical protein